LQGRGKVWERKKGFGFHVIDMGDLVSGVMRGGGKKRQSRPCHVWLPDTCIIFQVVERDREKESRRLTTVGKAKLG